MSNQIALAPRTGQSYRTPNVVFNIAVSQSYRTPDVTLAPISRQYIAPASTTLYTYPTGIFTPQFGVAEVSAILTRFVYPNGFSSLAFGSPRVGRIARPTGFSASVFGAAWVSNLRRYVYPNGTRHTALGTPLVQYKNIHASGFVATRFGTAYAYNKTQTAYANSFVATRFGTAKVENHKIVFVGQVHTAFGTALVKNFKQYANVTAGVLTRFGTQWASTNPRRIYMWHPGGYHDGQWHVPTWPDEQIGTAALTHTRITPQGFVATRFGVAWAAQEIQYLHPWSFLDVLFGNQTAVTYKNQPRQMAGFEDTRFGAGSMIPLYLHPQGIEPTSWPASGPVVPYWTTSVSHDRIKNASVGSTQRFGTPYVSHTPVFVYPPSFDVTTLWGVPPYGVMHKFDQWVSPEGLETEEWGRDDWDYRQGDVLEIVDYVPPIPVSDALFGSAAVGHGL